MFGQNIPSRSRRGTEVDMHRDEGFNGQIVPGYSGVARVNKKKPKVIAKTPKRRN